MMEIVENKIKCNLCGDEIISTTGHDFKWCGCKLVAVDGGKNYLRRVGVLYTELSKVAVPYDMVANLFKSLRKAEKALNQTPNTYIPSLDKFSYEVVSEISKILKKYETI